MNDERQADDDDLVERILDVFAEEARVDRSRLLLHARADELGVQSIDLAVALFEIEERFGVDIAGSLSGTSSPTVGDIVQQVLAGRERRHAAAGGA
jgi:acyl carrier protein